MSGWNPWHGCHKLSEGCRNCYVFRIDARHGKDSSVVFRTTSFDLPLRRRRSGEYKLKGGEVVYTCFSSDFFVEEADVWRPEAWKMIRARQDLHFYMITKRIDRLVDCVPEDWGQGYENVTICCTMENQDRVDYRLPLYLAAPVRHKCIVCEPLLGPIDFGGRLTTAIKMVIAGGESGNEARPCDYNWVLDIRQQCIDREVPFYFKQTGACLLKDGKLYAVPRHFQHVQARKAGLDFRIKNFWEDGVSEIPG